MLNEVVASSAATNYGFMTIDQATEFDVTSGAVFVQAAGETQVFGSLVAATITASGGLLDYAGAIAAGQGVGAFRIGALGALAFDAAVDNGHTVTFLDTTGALELSSPSSFAATIVAFSGDDAIDLLNVAATGFAYAGAGSSGALTVSGAAGTIATLTFKGAYSNGSFTLTGDGHGGTLILA